MRAPEFLEKSFVEPRDYMAVLAPVVEQPLRSTALSALVPSGASRAHRVQANFAPALVASAMLHLLAALATVWSMGAPRNLLQPSPMPVHLVFVEPSTPSYTQPSIPASEPTPMTEQPPPVGSSVAQPVAESIEPTIPPFSAPVPKPRPVLRQAGDFRTRSPKERQKGDKIAESRPSPPSRHETNESERGNNVAASTGNSAAASPESPSTIETHGIRVLDHPDPAYPSAARRQHIQGDVLLRLSVDEQGVLASVAVERGSGYRVLDEAAIASVRLWRFQPAVQNGRPVSAVAELPVRFRLVN